MCSKSPEKRGRQKVVRPPTYRIENEYNPEAMPQYFQISVNVLEGRKLVWANPHLSNSYVIVVLGKKKHRTSIRRNMQDPHYRESFVFELYTTLSDLQQTTLWLAVMEPRCCAPPRLLGEASIDLGAIWSQPHHQAFHKWTQLFLPRDWAAGPVGFLQVDVSILFKAAAQEAQAVIRDNILEDHLLLHSDAQQQSAMYVIKVHGAFGLPYGTQCQNDKRFGKPPNTFVKVSFCGLGAKTGVIHRNNNPMYNEQISIVEMFPNMCQAIRFEVCSSESCFHRVLSCTQLKLGQVSYDGENGYLPTFGPSMIQMYGTTCGGSISVTGEEGPYHRGALVISLDTKVPYYHQGIRNINVEPIPPLKFENIWTSEDFCVFCPILEVSMLDPKVAGKFCGVAITVGEIPSDNKSNEEFLAMMTEIRSRKMHYTGILEVFKNQHDYGYIDFCNSYPILQFALRLPDFRYRMYRNNMILGIYNKLEQALNEMERKLKDFDYRNPSELVDELHKTIDDTAGGILKFIDIVQSTLAPSNNNNVTQYNTELDRKQIELQKEEFLKIYQQIIRKVKYDTKEDIQIQEPTNSANNSRKVVKILLAEAQNVALHLKGLINKNLVGWPDIVVWLLNNGSRVAFTKISSADVIYSVIPEQSGTHSGRIQTVYLKPLKCPKHTNSSAQACYCVVGKIELLVWMGLHRQRTAFDSCIQSGYKIKVKEYDMCIKCNAMMIECRAFIYKAKLTCDSNCTNSMQLFVRINTMNSLKDTEMKCKTLSPVWNQVLKINRMIFMPPERLVANPPIVLVQVNNHDLSGKTELIGRIEIHPTVSENHNYQFAPKLQWYDLFRGLEFVGQILISVQLLQIPEKILKNTIYSPVEEVFVTTSKETDILCNAIEPLPINVLPISTSYKIDVYWWGLRDVNATRKPCIIMEIEDLSIKSDIISDKKPNCNFPNGRTTQMFEAYLNEAYCPPLSIKLFDSSTFGRSLYLGTNVVKNPNKYKIEWLPEEEREASLKRVSIMSSEFIQVNQRLFIKKSSQFLREDSYSSKSSIKSLNTSKTGTRKWYHLFSKREPDEEKYILLPVFAKKNESNSLAATSSTEQKDWWLRYLRSQKDYNDEDNIINTCEKFVIYEAELELQPEFSKFKDWCATLKLYNGKKTDIPDKDEKLYYGFLKAGLAIYKWPPPANTIAVTPSGVDLNRGFFDDYPKNEPDKFLIRVYVVKGIDLKIKEFTGKSDPYLVLSCGNKHIGDRSSHVPNSVNPIFGKMQEFRCTVPEDYLLAVSLYDFVKGSADKLIGTTTIDLEDRIYTKHRARVGLPSEYSLNEPSKWRDCVKPSGILEELCSRNHLPSPGFINSTTLIVNGVEYRNSERDRSFTSAALRKEKLCLNILNKWHTLPICGYHLVPEHVETRTLYNPKNPSIVQGKIQLWVDIFPLDTGLYVPPPINITPRKIEDYELRLTVYSARVLMSDLDNFGRKISDIYVKAWIGASDQYQNTDVHYQCLRGEANFNWRMIFHFQYQHAIRKVSIYNYLISNAVQLITLQLVSKEKGPFTEYEENIPPILVLQLLDNEESSPNEYLGSVMLNLNSMPRGVKQEQECTLETMACSKKVNLFTVKSMRSWWPLSIVGYNSGDVSLVVGMTVSFVILFTCFNFGHAFTSALSEFQRNILPNCQTTSMPGILKLTIICSPVLVSLSYKVQHVCFELDLSTSCLGIRGSVVRKSKIGSKHLQLVLGIYITEFPIKDFWLIESDIMIRLVYGMLTYIAVFPGKIDLELTLMTLEKASLMPVGVGREPPFPLPEPERPESDSEGFSNKMKSLKTMCCDRRCLLICFVCTLFLLIFFTVLYFQLPTIILDYFDMI